MAKRITFPSCLSLFVVVVAGCGRDSGAPAAQRFRLGPISGDSVVSAPVGDLAGAALRVVVRTEAGVPARGVEVRFAVLPGSTPAGQGPILRDSLALSDVNGVAEMGVRATALGDRGVVRASLVAQRDQAVDLIVRGTTRSTVASVQPANPGGGDTLIIRGFGLGTVASAVSVAIGGQQAALLGVAADTLVRAIVPACLPNGATSVTVRNGTRQTDPTPVTIANRGSVLALATLQPQVVTDTALGRGCIALPADGGRYLLVPHFASAIDGGPPAPPAAAVSGYSLSASATVSLAAGGAGAAPVPSPPPVLAMPAPADPAGAFHLRLRERERDLARRLTSPPAYPIEPTVVEPPAVGSRRTFQVIRNIETLETGAVEMRLAYVGANSLVYQDASPPAGVGFTDAELGVFAPLFDNALHGLAVNTFGPETDIDGNGRVIVLITEAINRLTPSSACGRFIAGLFYGLDLFPGERGSNGGEVFYAVAPDSAAAAGCARRKSDVRFLLPATFIHEFQHMISFGQHVTLRGGQQEDIWLNEGLSHIAEEAAGRWYESRYPALSGRTNPDQLFPDSAQAFSPPQLQNTYRWLQGLRTAGTSGTFYSGQGTLEERGATWAFLRWLGTQYGEGVFGRLVQTRQMGRANVAAATGRPFPALYGDFAAAIFADSIPGGPPRSAMPTRLSFGPDRNLRRIFARFNVTGPVQFPVPFPVAPDTLRAGQVVGGQLPPGGMQYTILVTPTGGPPVQVRFAPTTGTAFPAGVGAQVTFVRLP